MIHPAPLELLVCDDCGKAQYPDREICADCFGGELSCQSVDGSGELLSWTRLHASLEPMFQDRLPWLIASVRLQAGLSLLVHWAGDEPQIGQAVKVVMIDDPAGRRVLVGQPAGADLAAVNSLFGTGG